MGTKNWKLIRKYHQSTLNVKVTVTSERYMEMLQTFSAKLRRPGIRNDEIWFHEDGAIATQLEYQ